MPLLDLNTKWQHENTNLNEHRGAELLQLASPQVGADGIAHAESLGNQVVAKTVKKLTAGTPRAQS